MGQEAQQELPQKATSHHADILQTEDLPSIELSASENILALQNQAMLKVRETELKPINSATRTPKTSEDSTPDEPTNNNSRAQNSVSTGNTRRTSSQEQIGEVLNGRADRDLDNPILTNDSTIDLNSKESLYTTVNELFDEEVSDFIVSVAEKYGDERANECIKLQIELAKLAEESNIAPIEYISARIVDFMAMRETNSDMTLEEIQQEMEKLL